MSNFRSLFILSAFSATILYGTPQNKEHQGFTVTHIMIERYEQQITAEEEPEETYILDENQTTKQNAH